MNNTLTAAQFTAADDAVIARLQAAKRGTPERASADTLLAGWETVNALPQATWAQRQARAAAVATFAVTNGLV